MMKAKKKLLIICFLFYSAVVVLAQAQDRDTPIRGFTLASYSKTGYIREAETIGQVLEIYKDAGIHINGLVTFSINSSGGIEEGVLTPKLSGVKQVFDHIRDSGNIPGLSLYFDPADTSWRGRSNNVTISSAGPAVSSYFDSIKEKIRPALVNMSPEMVQSEYSLYWKNLISELRRLFPEAKIAYSTHYTSPVLKKGYPIPDFFYDLDYLGINLIVGAHSNVVEEQAFLNHAVTAAGEDLADRIEKKTGKKVELLFTEYGFPSHTEAASSPYDFKRGTADEELQYTLFKATLPFLHGHNFFVWSFSLDDFLNDRHYFWYKEGFNKKIVPKKAAEVINPMLIDNSFPFTDNSLTAISQLERKGEPEFIKRENRYVLSRPLFIYRDFSNSFPQNPISFYYRCLGKDEESFSLTRKNLSIDGKTSFRVTIRGYSFATGADKYEAGKIIIMVDPHRGSGDDGVKYVRNTELPFNDFTPIFLNGCDITGFSGADLRIDVFPSDFATVIYSCVIEFE